jgi:hypothetical protein
MNLIQSKPKFKRRYLIAGGLIAASSLAFFSPISAKAAQISVSSISSLFGAAGVDVSPYMEYLTAAEDFYKAVSTKNLSKVLSGIEVASGELGIPIPEEVQKAIDAASSVQEGQSAFGIGGSAALDQVLQGQVDATSTSTIAESTLSSQGQSDIVATKKSTAEAAASSLQSAKNAGASNVSQAILRDIATQMSNSVAIEKATYDTNVDSQVANAATSQAIGNISQTLAEDNWGKKVERQAGLVGIGDSTALFAALASPN